MSDDTTIVQCTQGDLRALRAEAKQQGVREALSGAASTQATGYFSTVRFAYTRTEPTPGNFVLTIAAGKRTAFGYKIDQDIKGVGAGYDLLAAAQPATLADTNLTDPNHTRDGEKYFIKGICHYLSDDSDGYLAKLIWAKIYAELKMGSNLTFPLGKTSFFPCMGGLSGRAMSRVIEPPLGSAESDVQSFQNGVEDSDSFFHFPEESPMVWNPSGSTDSQLSLVYTLPRDIVIAVAGRAAGAGVIAWEPPDTNEPFSYVDMTVRLVGRSLNKVSVNQ